MPSSVKDTPTTVRPPQDTAILLLSPHEEDSKVVQSVFCYPGWIVERHRSLSDARGVLGKPAVILCERDLPDGDWKDVLDALASQPDPAAFIVISPHADELLWAEVLSLGGYDVLQKPFDISEVTRVVGMAWRQRKNRPPSRELDSSTTFARPA